jgi:hypothetical protein
VLATPVVDRLVADAQELGDLGNLAAGCDKVEDLAAELGQIAAGHGRLRILLDQSILQQPDSIRAGADHSIMERWVQTCRRELLDRTLIRNQRHLLHALREFEDFYNSHRPHQGIANARPLRPLPRPISEPEQIIHLDIRRRQRLGGILHEYRHTA